MTATPKRQRMSLFKHRPNLRSPPEAMSPLPIHSRTVLVRALLRNMIRFMMRPLTLMNFMVMILMLPAPKQCAPAVFRTNPTPRPVVGTPTLSTIPLPLPTITLPCPALRVARGLRDGSLRHPSRRSWMNRICCRKLRPRSLTRLSCSTAFTWPVVDRSTFPTTRLLGRAFLRLLRRRRRTCTVSDIRTRARTSRRVMLRDPAMSSHRHRKRALDLWRRSERVSPTRWKGGNSYSWFYERRGNVSPLSHREFHFFFCFAFILSRPFFLLIYFSFLLTSLAT